MRRSFLAKLVLLLAAVTLGLVAWAPRPDHPVTAPRDDDAPTGDRTLCLLAMEQLALDVAHDRRPLVDAAALFAELDRQTPEAPDPCRLPPYDSLPTREERLCRRVIAWVDHCLWIAGRPAERQAAVARLDEELRRLQEQGPIRLPDPASLEPVEPLLKKARAHRAAPIAAKPVGERP
jgi:hypothetical protein